MSLLARLDRDHIDLAHNVVLVLCAECNTVTKVEVSSIDGDIEELCSWHLGLLRPLRLLALLALALLFE